MTYGYLFPDTFMNICVRIRVIETLSEIIYSKLDNFSKINFTVKYLLFVYSTCVDVE